MAASKPRQKHQQIQAGNVFGRLTVVSESEPQQRRGYFFVCVCTCLKTVIVHEQELRSGDTRSCGCLKLERQTTHGMTKTHEYQVWADMLARCNNSNHKSFRHYGGRGISVCTEWSSFEAFFSSVGPRPSRKHSLDRYPDNNGNYEHSNCRWATTKEQRRNTRRNHDIEYQGQTRTLTGWSEVLGMSQHTLNARINDMKWSIDKAFTTPVAHKDSGLWRQDRLISFDGKTLSVSQWSLIYAIKVDTILNRLNVYSWTVEKAITTPPRFSRQ